MPDLTIEHVRLVRDITSSVLALFALIVAVYVAKIRWNDVFRSDLRKRELEELATVRQELHNVWFEIGYLPAIRQMLEINQWNLDDLRAKAPDDWEGYRRYSDSSRKLFYRFQYRSYFLFPPWLDPQRVATLKSTMSTFVPFTLMSSTHPEDAVRRRYMDEIQAFINYLDRQIRKHY
ncbi:MAG: hypothetical protein F4X58_10275 [Chloroflexi bacterium]|nr:hypothetical protein [Acidobacteriota bacterium]MYC02294.1 hypothetical protein [Chloroflexota bacterium]